jgi:tetratricopeptide (TPR) repeat protein
MILRFSNTAARLTLIFVALALAIALVYSSVRNALAAHYASLGTRAGYERAARLEPGNPLDWYLLGRYWQYNLDEPDNARSILAYRTSLSLDSRAAATWLDLATAYELVGNLTAARDAFLQAQRAYPLSAEVSWRYGNFLLRQGELSPAFAEIRHAVSTDPQRAAEALSRCWRADPDIQAILDNVLPPSGTVYLDAIRELLAGAQITPALAVWSRLVANHPPLHLSDVIPFADMLVSARRVEDARRVWEQAAALSSTPPPNDAPGSVVWDGGFESGVTGGGFAWYFAPPSGGVQVSVDSKEKHSGRQSLRLGFGGKHNVDFSDVCHLAAVQPRITYRLSAWVRTQELSTDQGIRLRLDWLENSHGAFASTPEVHGTQPWTKLEIPWSPGPDVRQVRVCVCRNPSDTYGSRIHGTAWVDDVALVPASPENRKS